MRGKFNFLYLGMFISLLLHGFLMQSLYALSQRPEEKHYPLSYLVPVEVSPPKPKPLEKKVVKPEKPKPEPKKKKVIRITKKTKVNPLPVSHIKRDEEEPRKKEDIKPVFGVSPDTVVPKTDSGIGVRVGNTLMKEQEKQYTPPERVKQYITVPLFEISSLPSYKARIMPEYPKSLKEEGVEGEVTLMVTINEDGQVVEVAVKKSDHQLFSQAAIKAIKKCDFSPATRNGKPVSVKIDIPVKFILDT